MIDFHSHILPGIDDGAKDSKTAIEMLKLSKSQGVDKIIATPHFYCNGRTTEDFLEKREFAYNRLMSRIKEWGEEENVPEIKLGCELHLSISLQELHDIDKLTIEGTNYLMIEMPYQLWQPWMYELIYSISVKYKVRPIMAHIERYCTINKNIETYGNIFSLDVLGQVNGDGFMDFWTRQFLKKLNDRGWIHLLGSDMHNMSTRKTVFDEVIPKIEKKFGPELLEKFEAYSEKVINNQ